MSAKSDWYNRTYGMSLYTFLTLCSPRSERWYKDAMANLDEAWLKETKAEEIVGKAEKTKKEKEWKLPRVKPNRQQRA